MGRIAPRTTLRQISEINLTPLMDLTFILLITFIITFPLIEQGIPVNLPIGSATTLEPEEARTITIDADGRLYLDDEPSSLEALTAHMRALGRSQPETLVMVRADEKNRYGAVVEVLKVLHGARITRMSLVTQAED